MQRATRYPLFLQRIAGCLEKNAELCKIVQESLDDCRLLVQSANSSTSAAAIQRSIYDVASNVDTASYKVKPLESHYASPNTHPEKKNRTRFEILSNTRLVGERKCIFTAEFVKKKKGSRGKKVTAFLFNDSLIFTKTKTLFFFMGTQGQESKQHYMYKEVPSAFSLSSVFFSYTAS